MAISYVDTRQLEDISKDLLDLAMQLNDEINDLFSRFSEVTTVTNEWVGKQAEIYFRIVANDKKTYNEFASRLKEISYMLSKNSYEIQTCINKNYSEES